MKLIEVGESPPRNVHCWNAIKKAAESWNPRVKGGRLEVRFGDDPTVLQFQFTAPGMEPCTAEIDVSWIAYCDQADRLGILTKMALVDIDLELVKRLQNGESIIAAAA
jgi:hypothetical protein